MCSLAFVVTSAAGQTGFADTSLPQTLRVCEVGSMVGSQAVEFDLVQSAVSINQQPDQGKRYEHRTGIC